MANLTSVTVVPGANDASAPIPVANERFIAPVVAENPTDGSHLLSLSIVPTQQNTSSGTTYTPITFSDLIANQKDFKSEIDGWPYVHITRIDVVFTPTAGGATFAIWLGPDLKTVGTDFADIVAELNAHAFVSTSYNLHQESKTLSFAQGMSMQMRPTPITALHPKMAFYAYGPCYVKIDIYYTTGGLKRVQCKVQGGPPVTMGTGRDTSKPSTSKGKAKVTPSRFDTTPRSVGASPSASLPTPISFPQQSGGSQSLTPVDEDSAETFHDPMPLDRAKTPAPRTGLFGVFSPVSETTSEIEPDLPELPHDPVAAFDRVSRRFAADFQLTPASTSVDPVNKKFEGPFFLDMSDELSKYPLKPGEFSYGVYFNERCFAGGKFSRTSTTKRISINPKHLVDFKTIGKFDLEVDPHMRFRFYFHAHNKHTPWAEISQTNPNHAFDITAFHSFPPQRAIKFLFV